MVIDTSAIIAILFHEAERDEFLQALARHSIRRMSAASLVETGVVLTRKRRDEADASLRRLLTAAAIRIDPVTAEHAALAWEAARTFGKGRHPAALNFGDTFAYALAKATGEPLLYKGGDFAQTDVVSAV